MNKYMIMHALIFEEYISYLRTLNLKTGYPILCNLIKTYQINILYIHYTTCIFTYEFVRDFVWSYICFLQSMYELAYIGMYVLVLAYI